MPSKSRIWCAHPYHGEVLPNGKKRFSKIGAKPSHPKGKRLISKELAEFINNHNETILNGYSKQLSKADYLCSPCFVKERNRNILLPRSRHNNEPRTLSSLDLSIDDAIWILDSLRELFSISDNNEQKRLMTMLLLEWGRDRIYNWFRGSQHHARQSIKLRTTIGDFSRPEDRRGNKPLDNQI
ncbi:unnamed protein product [Rotaria sp. Silwood2]|nr:unnamed protein product [Rotaria sp. Silwood2]CAF4475373.1 unnamed protein product [Rotaria sp. Silwood2]